MIGKNKNKYNYDKTRVADPLQYSCAGNPMDRGAWQAAVRMVAESDMTEATQHIGSGCRPISIFMHQTIKSLLSILIV